MSAADLERLAREIGQFGPDMEPPRPGVRLPPRPIVLWTLAVVWILLAAWLIVTA